MPELLVYILKVAFCVGVSSIPVLLLSYTVKEYRGLRILCLAIVVSSFLFPVLHVNLGNDIQLHQIYEENEVSHWIVEGQNRQSDRTDRISIWTFIEYIYIIVSLALLLRISLRIVHLRRYMHSYLLWKEITTDGITIYCHIDHCPPMSWMHSIAISESDYYCGGDMILAHEHAHIHLGHSYDKILLSLFTSLQWFNPFAWMLSEVISNVHEYEADHEVLHQGYDRRMYQLTLLRKAQEKTPCKIAHTLNGSKLRQRIMIMNNKKSLRYRSSLILLLLLLPLTSIEILLCSANTSSISIANTPKVVCASSPEKLNEDIMKKIINVEESQLHVDRKKTKLSRPHEKEKSSIEIKANRTPALHDYQDKYYIQPSNIDQLPEYTDGLAPLTRLIRRHIDEDTEKPHYVVCIIGIDGRMRDIQLIGDDDATIDIAAIQQEACTWIPARKDGKKVATQITIPIQ